MSNHTTKAQREQWIARADELIELDADAICHNGHETAETLRLEFGISRGSALTATAAAIRRKRFILHPPTAAAASLGSMTSARKAAASRANGRKGGRPRKEKGK